jgi:urea transport system permease protein
LALSHQRSRERAPAVVVLIGVALALLLAVPVLNLLPADSPFYLSDFTVVLVGKYLCYAMLALSIDLIWGYCGVLSLGHGAFFALGGYAMGMYLMRSIGTRGVYRDPILPDFMVFLNWKTLPWYWYGFDHFAFAAAMVVLVPGVLALAFGWLAFRSRITGVYFSIITQALTFALMLAFFRNDMGFGGNNGMTDFKDLLGFPLNQGSTRRVIYLVSLVGLVGTYLICRWITTSKLGRVLIAIRDASSRVRFLGYSVTAYQLFVFTLSAMLAGVAGALYVPQVGIINPSEYSPANSIEAVIWVAVGGRGSLYGAVLGAFAVNGAKTWLTTSVPELWLFVLGGLFIAVTLFLPRGLIGLIGLGGGVRRRGWGGLDRLIPRLNIPKPRRGDG